MRAFRFRLDKVLEWYEQQCRIEESRLSACVAAVNAVVEAIARLEAERRAVDEDLIQRETIDAHDLAALSRYRLRAAQLTVQLGQERAKRQSATEQQRTRVQAARRRLKLVEKLRERRLQDYVLEENRENEILATESFLAKWVRSES